MYCKHPKRMRMTAMKNMKTESMSVDCDKVRKINSTATSTFFKNAMSLSNRSTRTRRNSRRARTKLVDTCAEVKYLM